MESFVLAGRFEAFQYEIDSWDDLGRVDDDGGWSSSEGKRKLFDFQVTGTSGGRLLCICLLKGVSIA